MKIFLNIFFLNHVKLSTFVYIIFKNYFFSILSVKFIHFKKKYKFYLIKLKIHTYINDRKCQTFYLVD